MAADIPLEPYLDQSRTIQDRAADLLNRLTLDEKVAQLTSVWMTFDPDSGEVAPSQFSFGPGKADDPWTQMSEGIGQITRPLGSQPIDPVDGARFINDLQRRLLEESRIGIPAICHEECLTGAMFEGATSFPSPLNFAATWDEELIERVGATIGRQMRAVGARQGLAPVADVARDARWGRVEETLGEDPYLVGRMVTRYVQGVQSQGVIATLKHFAGYSGSAGGRNFAPVHVGRRELTDLFLLPFEMAVTEGRARSVMNSYADVDGEAPAASRYLLTEVLREQWGFDGVVVADYGAISFLHLFNGVAEGTTEAAALALQAGLDVELPNPAEYPTGLPGAIDAGLITESDLDRSVLRVLGEKLRLGLFEEPFVDVDVIELDTVDDQALAAEVARRSMTLLHNDGVLPLALSPGDTVAVIGPNADEAMALFGNYSFENHVVTTHFQGRGDLIDAPTVLDDLGRRLDGQQVGYALGCSVQGDGGSGSDAHDLDVAEALAAGADVAIVVVGDKAGHFKQGTVGEGTDATSLSLPGRQPDLLDRVAATGTPTVVVLLNGRPFALGEHIGQVGAIVEAWFPGQAGAGAIGDVLVGAVCPAGRTAISFSTGVGVQPSAYNAKPLARGFPAMDGIDAVFPFGHGLSFVEFEYSDLSVDEEVPMDGDLHVSATITNTGDREADEVVQLYVRDPVASVSRPVKELKGFCRVTLAPHQPRRVSFGVPTDLLAFVGVDGERGLEAGELEVSVGASSRDIRLEATTRLVGDRRLVLSPRRLRTVVTVE